jgi:hypothetical protein
MTCNVSRSDLESFLVGITESQDGVIERINAPEQSTHRSTGSNASVFLPQSMTVIMSWLSGEPSTLLVSEDV